MSKREMDDELPLFGRDMEAQAKPEPIRDYEVPPHVRRSETSTAAAMRVAPRFGSKQRRVLDFVEGRGATGATCDEVEVGLNMLHQSASGALNTLEKKGWLHATTARRMNRSGSLGQVYLPGIGPLFQSNAPKPKNAFRKGQRVKYQIKVGGQGGRGEGKITHKIVLDGERCFVIEGILIARKKDLTPY